LFFNAVFSIIIKRLHVFPWYRYIFIETGSELLSLLIQSLKDNFEHAILVFNQNQFGLNIKLNIHYKSGYIGLIICLLKTSTMNLQKHSY